MNMLYNFALGFSWKYLWATISEFYQSWKYGRQAGDRSPGHIYRQEMQYFEAIANLLWRLFMCRFL